MKITKVEDGLLEQDDYLLTTRTTEFLGEHTFSRTTDILSLNSGYLERNLKHNEFVIVVDKEPDILNSTSKFSMYTRKDTRRIGIEEISDGLPNKSATNWKIVQYDGFVQTYMSYDDKKTWIACGGGQIREYIDIQGFYIEGDVPLRLKKYALYRNPYVRIFDVGLDYKVDLVDAFGNIIDSQVCDTGDVKFLLNDIILGKFVFYDETGMLIHETPVMEIKLGDSYINVLFDVDLYYGSLIKKYSTTKLRKLNDVVQIKNNSNTDTYKSVVVSVVNETTDIITVSLDGNIYDTYVEIEELRPQETRDIQISITKDRVLPHFGRRSFVLEIE